MPAQINFVNPYNKRDNGVAFQGSLGICEALDDISVIAIVGGGIQPAFPRDEVKLWSQESQTIVRSIKLSSAIKCVRLMKDM